jgi:hypothetical protein
MKSAKRRAARIRSEEEWAAYAELSRRVAQVMDVVDGWRTYHPALKWFALIDTLAGYIACSDVAHQAKIFNCTHSVLSRCYRAHRDWRAQDHDVFLIERDRAIAALLELDRAATHH